VESEHGVSVAHDSTKDNRTVFVSNLDYSVGDATIREVFSSLGTVTDLRLVKDFKGRSKGYCYIEFSSPVSSLLWTHVGVHSDTYMHSSLRFVLYVFQAEAEAALKRDREPIDGRPMFISRCDSDKRTRQCGFKYSTTLEKSKLFVKGEMLSFLCMCCVG
jgi:hypothetical protein